MIKKYLEQDLVNIIASMTIDIPNYPKVFYEAGYKIEYLEKEFFINFEGKQREVKFDIVLNNLENNHSLHFECKSGNISEDQLKRYTAISSEDVILKEGVTSNNPTTHTHDVCVSFTENHKDFVKDTLKKYEIVGISNIGNPIVISKENEIEFYDEVVEFFFENEIEYPETIFEVVSIGATTHESKMIKLIANVLVSFSVSKFNEFTLNDVCCKVYSNITNLFNNHVGEQEKKMISKKILKLLEEASKYELKDYFTFELDTKIGILTSISSGCNPIKYKKFKQLALEMAERKNKNLPVPKKYLDLKNAEGQISIFNQDE